MSDNVPQLATAPNDSKNHAPSIQPHRSAITSSAINNGVSASKNVAAAEFEHIDTRLEDIQQAVADRAVFSDKDRATAGAIVTVADEGTLQVIRGLVQPEDLPAAGTDEGDAPGQATATTDPDVSHGATATPNDPDDRIRPPAMSAPAPDRPIVRRNDGDFDKVSPGEQMLEHNRNSLPLDWLALQDVRDNRRLLRRRAEGPGDHAVGPVVQARHRRDARNAEPPRPM